jgi:hypothetical protein
MRQRSANSLWFRQQVQEALDATRRGEAAAAIELLSALAEHCRAAAGDGLSTWHEIQALWLLGVELEGRDRFKEAARIYSRIARLRRMALREAETGLPQALAAAALCEFKAGNRKAGMALATEVLESGSEHVSERERRLLRAEIDKHRQTRDARKR